MPGVTDSAAKAACARTEVERTRRGKAMLPSNRSGAIGPAAASASGTQYK